MLSRANVPTVEAGSFPIQRVQPAPHPQSHILAPNDSASQTGKASDGQKFLPSGPPNQTDSGTYSVFATRPASANPPSMPPPVNLPAPGESFQHHSPTREPAFEQFRVGPEPGNQLAGTRSNISLSTATTLVPPKMQLGPRMIPIHSESDGNAIGPRNSSFELPQPHTEIHSSQQGLTTSRNDQESNLGLPPKRELPFPRAKAKVQSGTVHKDRSTHFKSGEETASTDGHPSERRRYESVPVASAAERGKRKRGPTKPVRKGPAPKKPRAPASRTKAAMKAAQAQISVPTVEELLQLPSEGGERGATRSHTSLRLEVQHAAVEQVPRLEIPNSQPSPALEEGGAMGSPTLGGTTRRITRSQTNRSARAMEAAEGDLHKVNPCTPAEQIIMPLIPSSPVATAHPSPPQARHKRVRDTLPNKVDTTTTRLHDSSIPETHLLSIAESFLEVNSQFTDANNRLEAWSALPKPLQTTSLRSYFCHLIVDENFVNLCKTLDLFWEGVILNRRLEEAMDLQHDKDGEEF